MKRKGGAKLGQHFLTGTWAAAKLVESAQILPQDIVLEIGPGKGALTKELLKTGARILAIEKDESLIDILHQTFSAEIDSKKLNVICADVRDFNPTNYDLKQSDYILAANIPYYITGEIIRQFLTTDAQPKTMALLVQKEVAERVIARDGKESILSISVKAYGKPEIAAKVAKGNFNPPPSVDSAILVVRNISKMFFENVSEESFFKVVRTGFSSKRKLLASNLSKEFEKEKVLRAFGNVNVPEKVRAEDVSLQQWKTIAEILLPHR